jgi:hypothetical protein
MKTNPENPVGWTLPAELPPAFALPQQFRESLPAKVQQWLASVEKRIDGLTLGRIEREADELAGEDSPEAERLYRLGRRLFYVRCQQITDLVFPGGNVEVGINLLWGQTVNTLPGGAVSNALNEGDGDGFNTLSKQQLKEAGV